MQRSKEDKIMKNFPVFLFGSLLCLFSLVLVMADASGQQCLEEDSGAVDIEGTQGTIGQEIQIPVRIQSAPDAVTSFGFEIIYDPNVLEYSNFERGDLTAHFDMFDVNHDPDNLGRLTVGGFCSSSQCGILQEANGCLVWLTFTVQGGQEDKYYPLHVEKLKDHIANFSSSGGCFSLLPDNNNPEDKVAVPVISPGTTVFTDSIEVTITCATPEVTIRYTADGSDPTENSLVYSGPIILTDSTTIKAQGFKSDWTQSGIVSKTYTKQNEEPSHPESSKGDDINAGTGKNTPREYTGSCFLTSISHY
ncbi:MAG: FN3 associated domain-containing protein [bacterium]